MNESQTAQLENDCRMVEKWITCVQCDGKGTSMRLRANQYNPWEAEEYSAPCRNCGGSGETAIEVCNACGKCEDECKCLDVLGAEEVEEQLEAVNSWAI